MTIQKQTNQKRVLRKQVSIRAIAIGSYFVNNWEFTFKFDYFSGKDRNLNIVELLCAKCNRWFHESCIGYQLGKLVPFLSNYVFMCKNCSPTGLESFKKTQARKLAAVLGFKSYKHVNF